MLMLLRRLFFNGESMFLWICFLFLLNWFNCIEILCSVPLSKFLKAFNCWVEWLLCGHVKFSEEMGMLNFQTVDLQVRSWKECMLLAPCFLNSGSPHHSFQVHVISSFLLGYTLPSSKSNWTSKPLNYSAGCTPVSSVGLPKCLQHGSQWI